jgi:hypothetical protein
VELHLYEVLGPFIDERDKIFPKKQDDAFKVLLTP